jgi:hypothetical protein
MEQWVLEQYEMCGRRWWLVPHSEPGWTVEVKGGPVNWQAAAHTLVHTSSRHAGLPALQASLACY